MISFSLNQHRGEVERLEKDIFSYPAWHGLITGLECEALLKGKPAFSYLIRGGEARLHYYLSYVVEAPFIYKHQPFTIAFQDSKRGWGHRNAHDHWVATLDELVGLITHQSFERCIPILKTEWQA